MQEILQKQGMIGGKQMRFRCRKTPINLLSIQVFGAGGSPQLQSKSVTPSASTQYVYPSSRYDGLSQVTVNGDSNLIASNIKKGTTIFNVSRTLEAAYINNLYVDRKATVSTDQLSITLQSYYPDISSVSGYIIYSLYKSSTNFSSTPTVMHMSYFNGGSNYECGVCQYGQKSGSSMQIDFVRVGLRKDFTVSSDKRTVTFPSFQMYGDWYYYNTSTTYYIFMAYTY